MIKFCTWLGKLIFEYLEITGRTVQLVLQTFLQLRRMNVRHVIYQMAHLGVDATARASFGVYNSEADVAALVKGIERVTRIFG